MHSREVWNSTTICSKGFVMLTNQKNLKWTQTPSTWFCRMKIWKGVVSLKSETSGMQCVWEIAQTLFLPMQQTVSFPECVATHTGERIRGNQVSLGKNLDVQKCCVYSLKPIVAMIERVTSEYLAPEVQTNEL